MLLQQRSSFGQFLKTIFLGAILIATILAIKDPKGILSKEETSARVLPQRYGQLLAIELLQNDKARLGYINGSCETNNDLKSVLRAIKQEGKWEWFFGIPMNGTKRKGEYINLVYVDHFERIICEKGVYYRARLNVKGRQCHFVEGLITCGTEFFSERTYRNMVNALEKLGVGDANHFKPKRTLKQKSCECY